MDKDTVHKAMFSESLPINPIPFATALASYVRENGTNSIESDEAKAILWVLMAQSYGSLSAIDLTDEWARLYAIYKEVSDDNS